MKEQKFNYEVWYYCNVELNQVLQAGPPPLQQMDAEVDKLNTKVWRLIMLPNMRIYPGMTHIYANEKELGPLPRIDGRPYRGIPWIGSNQFLKFVCLIEVSYTSD